MNDYDTSPSFSDLPLDDVLDEEIFHYRESHGLEGTRPLGVSPAAAPRDIIRMRQVALVEAFNELKAEGAFEAIQT